MSAEVVRRLVDSQFPQWASLPIDPIGLDGWDNTTYRLGDELSVRLPNGDAYAPQVDKEHHWLPRLARHLPVVIPESVAVGAPCDEFPRPWSIRRWIDGEPAATAPVDRGDLARHLAAFLRALQRIDARDGPPAGPHSFFRGGPLHTYDAETRESMRMLGDRIDQHAVASTWRLAVASRWEQQPVWVHGDMAASNLIVRHGQLVAVIDFGCAAVGDPACDLVAAWTLFDSTDRDAFMSDLGLDHDTWDRARGWALWKALRVLVNDTTGDTPADDAVNRFGWRTDAAALVDELTQQDP